MALPALINGADCGPLNPLQSLSKQFDRDRGVQSDHFGVGRPGPSREVFRTQITPAPGLAEEAARFFAAPPSSVALASQHVVPNPFDLSSLRESLSHQQQLPMPSNSSLSWASDFLNLPSQTANRQSPTKMEIRSYPSLDADRMESPYGHHVSPINNTLVNGVITPQIQHRPIFHNIALPELHPHPQHPQMPATISSADFPQEEAEKPNEPVDADELSRTAGLLVDAVKGETNPKFQNSAFLALMRQLRDKEMVIEGSDVVISHKASMETEPSSLWSQEFTQAADVKGKRKAVTENGWADTLLETPEPVFDYSASSMTQSGGQESSRIPVTDIMDASDDLFVHPPPLPVAGTSSARKSVHFSRPEVLKVDTISDDQSIDKEEDANDEFWRRENAEYQAYWNAPRDSGTQQTNPEWDRLQADWDRFEATATGIKPVSVYQFQPNNPYLWENSSTRNHLLHTSRLNSNASLLEKEAAVQNNLRKAEAWFELGVKQQENERERHAIEALQRAVELDPSYLEAWLALAISQSNEGNKNGAYDAIERWIRNNKPYKDDPLVVSLSDPRDENSASEQVEELMQCLMGLAREASAGEIDADIQTALGVLLTTREDYAKAQDCFRVALSVRPDDWLLYNRVGATLANSGHSDEAMWYYHRALELNPSYIRARFNLGISCINLRQYDEAAGHILDALVLQEADAPNGPDTRGVAPSALWECLRTTCMHLQRPELASLCDSQDLEGFRKAFGMG